METFAHHVWNFIDILVALVAAGFNFGYWYSHVNGKKYIRLWIGIILLAVAAMRTALLLDVIPLSIFMDVIRPFSILIYLAFCFGPYIDWNTMAKIERGK